jgi:hypothetical protein
VSKFAEILAYAVFAAFVGLLSVWPPYKMLEGGHAVVSLSFSHAGTRVGECRKLTQEELLKLPPNMRKPADCPRERHAVRIQLKSGDSSLYEEVLAPSGIWSDGKANVYHRTIVPAGRHELYVGMNDSGDEVGFDYESRASIDISAGRNVVIRFDKESRQFSIR